MSRAALLLLLLGSVALPASALAQASAVEAAAQAQLVHQMRCADVVAASDEGEAARAMSEVSDVWATVNDAYERTGEGWLLYWRGLLAECLGQNERAELALVEFIEGAGRSQKLAPMVRDARRRLRHIRELSGAPPTEAAIRGWTGAGIGLFAGAGVAAGLTAWQLDAVSGTRAELIGAVHPTDEADALIAEGNGQFAAAITLGAVAVGATVAGVALMSKADRGRKLRLRSVAVVPRPGGLHAALEVRW